MDNFGEFLLFETTQDLLNEIDSFLEVSYSPPVNPSQLSPDNLRLRKNKFIDPKTNSNWRATDVWEQIRAILKYETRVNQTDPKRIWVTFSEVSKLGQRSLVKSGKTTPAGIFAFPIRLVLKKTTTLPFINRPYVHIFKTKSAHFEVGHDSGKDPQSFVSHYNQGISREYRNAIDSIYNNFTTQLGHHAHYRLQDWGYNLKNELKSVAPSDLRPDKENYPLYTKWLIDPEKALDIGARHEELKKTVQDYLEKATEEVYINDQYKTIKKFANFDPNDLSVELSPEFAKLVEDGQASYYYKDYLNKRLTFKALQDIEYIEDVGNFDSEIKMIESGKEIMLNFLKTIKETIEKFAATGSGSKAKPIPHKDKLQKFADENGLDFESAISTAMKNNANVSNANQFLYRVTQQFAMQLVKKGVSKTWQVAWNSILRKLGITSIADTQHSGHIHTSEPTQGVFLDPKDIVFIDTIVQTAGSDKVDPANRPKADTWAGTTHQRIVNPKNQKSKGLAALVKGQNNFDKLHTGISYKLTSISNDLVHNLQALNNKNFSYRSADETVSYIAKSFEYIARLNYSFKKLVKSGHDPMSYAGGSDILTNITKILTGIKPYRDVIMKYPQTKQKYEQFILPLYKSLYSM